MSKPYKQIAMEERQNKLMDILKKKARNYEISYGNLKQTENTDSIIFNKADTLIMNLLGDAKDLDKINLLFIQKYILYWNSLARSYETGNISNSLLQELRLKLVPQLTEFMVGLKEKENLLQPGQLKNTLNSFISLINNLIKQLKNGVLVSINNENITERLKKGLDKEVKDNIDGKNQKAVDDAVLLKGDEWTMYDQDDPAQDVLLETAQNFIQKHKITENDIMDMIEEYDKDMEKEDWVKIILNKNIPPNAFEQYKSGSKAIKWYDDAKWILPQDLNVNDLPKYASDIYDDIVMKLEQGWFKWIKDILVPMKREYIKNFSPFANNNRDPIRNFIEQKLFALYSEFLLKLQVLIAQGEGANDEEEDFGMGDLF